MNQLTAPVEQDLHAFLRINPEQGMVNPNDMKQKVTSLQNELLAMPQADIRTFHSFVPGFYERTIVIPPWTVLTGAEHKTDYLVRVEKGTLAVNIDDEVKVLTAPCEFMAKAGAQRAGRVFDEEVVWVDVYENPDNCRDIEKLEKRYFNTYDTPLIDDLAGRAIAAAQADYKLFILQLGLSQEEVDKIVKNTDDVIDGCDPTKVELRPSKLNDSGVFAVKDFAKGEVVAPARLDGKRTLAGRYVNHSPYANLLPIKDGNDLYFVTTRNIYANEELLVDYRASVRVNFGLTLEGELLCQQP